MEGVENAKLAGSVAVGKIIGIFASFSIPFLLTRQISKEEYGILAQFNTIILFSSSFFRIGIPSNLYFFYPNSDQRKRTDLIINSYILLTIVGCITALILSITPISEKFLGSSLIQYKYIVICGIFFSILSGLIEPLYILKKDNYVSLLYYPVYNFIRAVILIGVALLFKNIYYILVGGTLTIIINWIFVNFYAFEQKILNIIKIFKAGNKSLIHQQLTYILPFGGATSLRYLMQYADKIICISFLTASEYATYSLAFLGVPGVTQFYDSISQVSVISLTQHYCGNNIIKCKEIYRKFIYEILSFTLPIILIIVIYAHKIIPIFFTTAYSEVVPLFRIYTLSTIFMMIGSDLVLRASNKTKYILKSNIIVTLVLIPLSLLLVHEYGLHGAIFSYFLGAIFSNLLYLKYSSYVLSISLIRLIPWKQISIILILNLALATILLLIEKLLITNLIVNFILGIIYVIIAYLFAIKLDLFIIKENQLKNLIKYLNKKIIGFINIYNIL